jgi:hypothetical protein
VSLTLQPRADPLEICALGGHFLLEGGDGGIAIGNSGAQIGQFGLVTGDGGGQLLLAGGVGGDAGEEAGFSFFLLPGRRRRG